MRLSLRSPGAGPLPGLVYALRGVRSPAPFVVALARLLGILVGEPVPPLVKAVPNGPADTFAIFSRQLRAHVFGHLPGGNDASTAASGPATRKR